MLPQQAFTELQNARPQMAARDHDFADSLLAAYSTRGWSVKQQQWAEILAKRVTQPQPAAPKVVDDLGPLFAAFDTARKHLKAPGFKILLHTGSAATVLRITTATQRSKTPGHLFVAGEGQFGERPYFGRLDLDGNFHTGRDGRGKETELHAALARFARDPVAAAKEYARLFGRCCFCDRELTDERSTAAGYGGTCAKNYGLPWGSKTPRQIAA